MRFRGEFAPVARRLEVALEPAGPAQLVHGDLTRNVLFAEGLAPAVIDVSLYWRPPDHAEGVVVADALCWHGGAESLLDLTGVPVAAVARALLFRLATNKAFAAGPDAAHNANKKAKIEARRYEDAASAIGL